MSFILDALKKLEREKETRDSGVVMVQPVPWGGKDRRGRGTGLAVVGTALVLVLGGSILWLRSGSDSPAPGQEGGEPAPSSSATGAETPAGPAPTPPPAAPGPEVGPADPTGRTEPPPPGDLAPPPSRALLPPRETAPSPTPEAPPGATDEPFPPDATAPAPVGEPFAVPSIADPAAASPPEPAPPRDTAPELEFRLTAISSRDGQPIALLNDRLVREGDRFGDITIIRIGETDVEIEVNGERKTIGF
jgi:hypothetical protein